MSGILKDINLAEMFGIEIASESDTTSSAQISSILCTKCHGRGNFVSRAGRVVGKCFTCNGTGVAAIAAPAKDGDCAKCFGSGEWRPGRSCFACNGTGQDITCEAINVDAISQSFASARDHGIKAPKLRLGTFIFSRAPDAGVNAGSIYVKQRAGGEYLGKISAGHFKPSMACDGPTQGRVIEAAANPHDSAKAYGMRTGQCSCCGRELTNGISIELGIGPICRDKFGW
jgi:hypothetical protein